MSFQSELTDDIAEELAQEQRSISVAEFFEKNRQMLGFDSPARALVTAVKEGVDNSLDACEEADTLPDIFVEIEELDDTYRVVIEDNGPGIVREQIPKIFGKLLYGSRFGKRVQARGQQGIGISAAVLYSQLTSGKPAIIKSKTKSGEAHEFEVIIDTDTNDPEIVSDEVVEWDRTRGTRIELQMEGNMRARKQLHEYVKNTAVVNPHARIHLKEPDDEFDFERATDELPKKAEEIDPHPHGIELGTLIRMLKATDSYSLSGFVGNEFTRVGSKTSDSMLDGFRDRYYGREAAWSPPEPHEADLEAAVEEAVSNKGGEATSDFAERIAGRVRDEDSVSHHRLVSLVDEAADETEDGHSTTFGDTVREKTVSAVWEVITEDRGADLYRVVDDATGNRKDDETLRALAERVGARFDETDRDRATRDEVGEFVEKSADAVEELRDTTFGETARENVAEAVWGSMETVPDEVPSVNDVAEDRELARMLLESMRETDVIAPPTDCLSPITDELVEAGLRKEFDADFYAASTRDASVQSGDPFVVEAGIAYGGSLHGDSKANLLRFANRVPLVYQQGACVITEAVEDIGWKNYGLDGSKGSLPEGPAVLMVHVASTNVPFTSESKDAIASVPEIRDEVERAVREVGRELKDHINKRESRRKRREKERVVRKLIPEMAEKVAEVTGRDTPDVEGTLARILNKLHVSADHDDGDATVTVSNYTGSKKEIELHSFVTDEPALRDGEADVVEMDGEYDVVWNLEIGDGETRDLVFSSESRPELTVKNLDEELLEVEA